jgi:hypothetical protein
MRLPNLSGFLKALETYRYSITVGLLLLFVAPQFFPLSWEGVGATWTFSAGLMFFLSVGMIVVRDAWPPVKQLFGIGVDAEQVALEIAAICESTADGPDFEISLKDVPVSNEDIKEFVADYFEHGEGSIEENKIIVTEAGLKRLEKMGP